MKEKNAEVVSILSRVCAQNLPLDLRIIGEEPASEYRSRFLNLDATREGLILIIEAPTSRGTIVPARPGEDTRVSFFYNGRDLSFVSQVLRRGKFSLSPTVNVPSLDLLVPEHASFSERRSFYRIVVTESPPIELKIGIFTETGKSRRIRSRVKGIITDIAGGGLGFCMSEGKSLLLAIGTRLLISFRLPDDEQEIKILGRICFTLRRSEVRQAFFGVQFMEIDSDIEYKQSVDKILRFVAERQRRMIKERTQTSS